MTPADWHTVLLTCGLGVLAVILALPPALALSYLLARKSWPAKSVVETLALLPLVMPPVATGLILLKVFGKSGPFGAFLHTTFGIQIIFTWKAVVIALAVMAFPLLIRSIRTAFEEIPEHLEAAARTLGCRPWKVFLTITLPLAKRGILTGILLAFARAVGEFGATIMVAGFIPGLTETLSLSIYKSVQTGDDTRALLLAGVSALIAFLAVILSNLIRPPRNP